MELYEQDAFILDQPMPGSHPLCLVPVPLKNVCHRTPCLFRDHVDEERAEKQVSAIMQKTLDQQGSHGRKFFYAISRSDCISFTNKPMSHSRCACLMNTSDLCMMQEMRQAFCRYQLWF